MVQTILILAFFMSLPVVVKSQEAKKEKKVTIKTVKVVDGKKTVTDTTFTVTDEDDVQDVVERFTEGSSAGSSKNMMVDVTVDVDDDSGEEGGRKKVVVISEVDGDDGHAAESNVVIVSPSGKHKVVQWKSEDGDRYEFEYEMDNFNEDMANLDEELKKLQFILKDAEGGEFEKMIELETIKELEGLDDMNVIFIPEGFSSHGFDNNKWFSGTEEVTDMELREAGIKNKPDRLEPAEIDIDNEDGLIDLSFVLNEDGAPRVTVYNIYGDKVFSGKPELMNGKFTLKMDLSKKQHGTYYLMIVVGNTSLTERIRL